jgi:DNA-3-methyladenine glycosylase I
VMNRCEWGNRSDLEKAYHDNEWGVPVHNDRLLFEFLILEGVQAGLSWSTVLKKRAAYRKAYDNFHANKIAKYSDDKINELLKNSGIIRNRLKINASVANALAVLKVKEEFGSFDAYIWKFVNGRPINHSWKKLKEIPASTPESEAMSKDLKKRDFGFVGPTICYAFMQAVGMVNDHVTNCFRYEAIRKMNRTDRST